MSDLRFQKLISFEDSQFSSGVYVLLINADKTPPHIAVLDNGTYYSLGVNGLRIVPYKSFKSYLDKKKSKVIFIELTLEGLDFDIEFSKYNKLNDKASTCLYPLKYTLKQQLVFDEKTINTIFDLMDVLKENDAISSVFERNINANSFTIKQYNLDDVFLRIENLTK